METVLPLDLAMSATIADEQLCERTGDAETEMLSEETVFAFSFDLEDFMDATLKKLNVTEEYNKEMMPITAQIKTLERKQRDIDKMYEYCQNQVQRLKEDLKEEEDEWSKQQQQEVVEIDSDDDVQFVEATFAPLLVSTNKADKEKLALQRQSQSTPQKTSTPAQKASSSPKIQKARENLTATLNAQSTAKLNAQGTGVPVASTSAGEAEQVPLKPLMSSGQSVVGPLHKSTPLAVGSRAYGKKSTDIWHKVKILREDKDQGTYRVKFEAKGKKTLSGKTLACSTPLNGLVRVGSRVIALYKDDDGSELFYAGIVAEPPSVRNSFRYLVFFDDGYAQYSPPTEIHKVYEQSTNVWEDICKDSQEFIKDYLAQYPERPMVRLQAGQVIKTEWNGQWWMVHVVQVDASLVKMHFDADNRIEWIYRGSTRLEPLFTALANAEANRQKGRRHNALIKSSRKPVVEYPHDAHEEHRHKTQETKETKPAMVRQASESGGAGDGFKRAVAKKSTGGKPREQETDPTTPSAEEQWEGPWLKMQQKGKGHKKKNKFETTSISSNRVDMATVLQERFKTQTEESMGERMHMSQLQQHHINRKKYVPHFCKPICLKGIDENLEKHKGNNPLVIPMLCGWERHIAKVKPSARRHVLYCTPCASRLRDIDEVDEYLLKTNSKVTIDFFSFDPYLHTDSEFVPVKTFCDIKDISYGKERVPISCVNAIDRQYPDYVEYSNIRTPSKGVPLVVDPDFLVSCDCTDGCRDKTKCACCQLTIEETGCGPGGKRDEEVGYFYRRLNENMATGVYECNSRCKCDCRCFNRVAQNGLALRLQVFKTEKRGWGLRCLDDIPHGGFICVYAGQLLTEQGANEDGKTYGDEYLAELDYIEVVERHKEGYESDVNAEKEDDGNEKGDGNEENNDDYDEANDSDSTFSGGKYEKRDDTQQKRILRTRTRREIGDAKKISKPKSSKVLDLHPDTKKQRPPSDCASEQKNTASWIKSIPDEPILIDDDDEEDEADAQSKSLTLDMDELPELDSCFHSSNKQQKDNVNKKAVEGDAKMQQNSLTASSMKRSRFSNLPNPHFRPETNTVKKPLAQKDNKKDAVAIPSTRSYFEDWQGIYVMDAKSMGNLGRYLNHNCSPNVFVQNVFVDTHDVRFPWVAFFAGQYIRAGTELTWDYNYEVGSVPGKILYCYCGSSDCRGRLL